MTPRSLVLCAALCAAVASLPSEAASPRAKHAAPPTTAYAPGATLASLRFPGTPAFVAVAKDVIALRFAMDPSGAANTGLFDDGCRIPSFAPDTVAARVARLDRDLAALRAMPWRTWNVDRQVDWRWIVANAEEARLQLADEKLYVHRPAAWLEPVANTFIALVTYAPERADIRLKLASGIPAMVAEMRTVVQQPTARDVTTAKGVADGILRKASPLGLRLTKQVLNETVNGIPLETALKLENRNQILASQTADAAEARQAWFEKREPQWRDA